MTRTLPIPAIPSLLLLSFLALSTLTGCSPGKEERGSASGGATVPTLDEAGAVTLRGLEGDSESVTLSGGRWEGPPYVAGSAARSSVYLVPGFLVAWNADGEGAPEAAVLVGENSGGSGEYIYLCLIAREGRRVVNRATALLGDRVQIVSAGSAGSALTMTLLRAGPEGALCCPDEVATLAYELRDGALILLPENTPPKPLTNDLMAGVDWTLDEADPSPGPAATLRYAEGRFQGNGGCNRYSMSVAPGELPGDLVPGPAISTRMACPDSAASAAESGFLARLGSVNKFGFSACRLMLLYENGEGEQGSGVLYFRRDAGVGH